MAEELHRASIAVFEALVHDYPASKLCRREWANAHLELGLFLMLCSRFDEAGKACRRAVEMFENMTQDGGAPVEVRQRLASAYRALGKLAEVDPKREADSAEYFRREMKIYDDLIANLPSPLDLGGRKALRMRAEALARGQSWKRATDDLLRLASAEPPDPAAWELLCIARLSTGDAKAYRNQCAELLNQYADHGDASLHWWIASCCRLAPIDEGDLARAVELAEKLVAGAPENERNRRVLAGLLYRAARFEESVEALDALCQVKPDESADESDALWMAMAQHRLGRITDARATYQQAGKLEPQAARQGALSTIEELRLELLRNEADQRFRNEPK